MIEILDGRKKKKILDSLAEYGIEKPRYLFIQSGKQKLRIFSGELGKDKLFSLLKMLKVETIGLYLGSLNNGLRLSIDACHIFAKDIKKKIIEITEDETQEWFYGSDIIKKISEEGFVVLKNHDFLGCGKAARGRIINFLPKERRIKK